MAAAMTGITDLGIRALAAFVHEGRPEWDVPGIIAALRAERDGDVWQLAQRMILEASLPEAAIPPGRARRNTLAHFWARVDRSSTGCWPWTGRVERTGYARFPLDGRTQFAHRIAYSSTFGVRLSPEVTIDHTCCNPICCNPLHLDPVTSAENAARGGPTYGRRRQACRNGHPHTPENTVYRPGGIRRCKQCLRDSQARYGRTEKGREAKRRYENRTQ